MQSGLWSRSGPVSLVDVSIKGRIVDFTGEVVVRQKYCNKEQNSVDAIFKFPLELFGALSGFEIVVGGKHIVAEVKNRAETNFQLSVRDDDVDDEEDDTSFLSTDDQPDVFLCNIGLLEPGQEVEFIVTYTTVLALVGDSLRFVIPSSTFSLKDEYEGAENETSPRKKLEISSEHNLLISLDVEMPSEIQKIESPTHTVAAEQSGNKATVSFTKGSATQEGNFVLLIKFQKPHSPYCFVQYDPKTDTKAVMLSFFPEFSLKALASCEIIFLVDCSSSMAGSQLESVKSALQLLLRSLPAKAYFNIVLFGTTFQKVFPSSVPYDNQSLETASKYVDEMDADLGGTEIYEPLAEVLSSPMVNNLPRQLFIITDGQVSNSKKIFNLISKHSHNTRVFTFGIGDRVSHHLVNGMARAGCGEAEFVTGSESLDLKIMRQLKRALQPALTNVHLDWGTFQNVVQAPRKLRTIFNGDRLLVYAFLPKDTTGEATVALKATASEGPVSFQVTLNANNYKTGNLIPILAARARIRDLEENDDDDEEFIRNEVVKLGTTYGLASSYTSFVAYIPVPEKKLSTDSIKRGFNLHSSMEMPVPSEKLSGETQPTIVKPKPILSVQVPIDVPDRSASVSPAPSSPAALGGSGKKIYTPDFLLRFRDLCTEMPSGLVPMDVILGGGRGKNEQSGKSPKGKGGGRGGKGHKRQQSSGGGRNNQKPKTPQSLPPNPLLDKPLVQSENRWTRPTVEQLSELEQKSRRFQGILNKLTVEKFVSLSSNLLEVGVTNPLILEELIKLVYTKAVAEPHFATLYAVLCKRLSEECPSFQDADGKPINFRRLLLNRCQTEFEKKAPPALDDKVDQLEREEVEFKFKRKVLGNIKFIGELFKEGMLPERVMHECLKMLLKDAEEASEDDIESLCKLITTIGKDLELPVYKLRDQVQVYFEKMEVLSKSEKLPSRFRFMLKDVIELRQNNWVPRIKKNEAKTLAAARAEIMEQEEEQQAPPPKSPLRRSESKETVRSQDARDQASPSPGGRGRGSLPRSASETSIGSESWEVVGGRGKAKGKQGWEVKSPGKPSGRGRGGYSPVADRYAKKPVDEKPKETYKPKGNIFSALGNEEQSNAPKSAMRSGKSASKAVTIQEPEPVKAEMSAEALANKIEMLIEEYLASADLTEAAACVEEVNNALPEVVTKGVQLAFDKKERDRQEILKLFDYLFTEGTIKGQDFEAGLTGVLSTIEEIDIDNPNASKFVGTFIGHFLGGAVQPAFLEREFGHLVDSGKAAQITALALQTVLKNKGESDLLDLYQGKINLLSLLPKDSRDKDNVSKFLLKHGLEGLEASIDGSDDKSDESKPSPSNNNNGATRGRSGSVSLTLETVIKKQCADGHWNLNSELESFRIGSLDAIKAAIPSYINNNESAWATSLALQLLELRFDASTDKWELLAEKGMNWLEEQAPDHIDQLQKDAQEFLKGRGL